MTLKGIAEEIAMSSIRSCLPEPLVEKALKKRSFSGRIFLVSVGKAAYSMARAAQTVLGKSIEAGIVVTKYGHVPGSLPGIRCFEGGHPVPDANGVHGTEAVLEMTAHLGAEDTVLFLLSGGGSALFEKPLIPLAQLQDITDQLLRSGAEIEEINTIRKRLSAVKGGRFAQWCQPARVVTLALSDVLGDRLDAIASGPTVQDRSTSLEARKIVERYGLTLSPEARRWMECETPRHLNVGDTEIIGSVKLLCEAAQAECIRQGFQVERVTDSLEGEAREVGRKLGKQLADARGKRAWVLGGETTVHVTGNGLGGRNQELALSAAREIAGVPGVCLLSVGSDGTDGPTDAAGGIVDGTTYASLLDKGISWERAMAEHDSYHALEVAHALVRTGPTGTNVNDLVLLLREETERKCEARENA
ncbi:MAG: glycerate kinase [Clostridia bacterium]|nr:glycerate kinase [Clostridia bacterium]